MPLPYNAHFLIILDSTRCPITGKQMKEPVVANDGITYEKENLETWIQNTDPPNSPISLATFNTRTPPKPNRAIKTLIDSPQETEDTQPTQETIMRVSLRASLQWIVEWETHHRRGRSFHSCLQHIHRQTPHSTGCQFSPLAPPNGCTSV
jgi:hypothetical protein